jgi:hypothetical protein
MARSIDLGNGKSICDPRLPKFPARVGVPAYSIETTATNIV